MLFFMVIILSENPNINLMLYFYIEFFKILPQMNIEYPLFYRTLFLEYCQCLPPHLLG